MIPASQINQFTLLSSGGLDRSVLLGHGMLALGAYGGTQMTLRRESDTAPVNIGIGTLAPAEKLHVVGNICATGTITPSDARFKAVEDSLPEALDQILALQGISYSWKTDEYPERCFPAGRQIGFVAQEVEKVIPEVVHTSDDGYKSMSYDKLTAELVEAIKDLKVQSDSLQAQLDELRREQQRMSKGKL